MTVKVPFLDLGRQTRRLRQALDRAMARVLERGQFILGPEVEAFEQECAATLGAVHAVGVANGTQALELILRARGIGPGAEVIVPALTSPFTALAVLSAGATPVFADVDPETLLLDPHSAQRCLSLRTRAVIPVHLYGRAMGLEPLEQLGVEIVQDAAHAHGAALGFRHPAAFSFYPTKNLGALGDGGAVLTDDPELAARVRRLRHGGQGDYAVVSEPGLNSRLDELQAAVLRVLLPRLAEGNRRRRELAQRYAEVPGMQPVGGIPAAASEHVFHLYVVRHARREALREHLERAGVATAVHYPVPLHRQPVFAAAPSAGLPAAETACAEILSLPLNPDLRDEEAAAVIAALRTFLGA